MYSICTVAVAPAARPGTDFVNGFPNTYGVHDTWNGPAGALPVFCTTIVAPASRPSTTDSVGSGSTGTTVKLSITRFTPGGNTVSVLIARLFFSFVSDTALPVSTRTTVS